MTDWENIWRFNTSRFSVRLDVAHDDWMDLSWDEDGDVARQINAGILGHFQFRVTVSLNGVMLGTDYLGGCIYENPEDFRGNGYFRGMVMAAIADARAFLKASPSLRAAA